MRRKPARIQTTIRMEKSMLKVLKALAEYYEMSLADLVEAIVLHSFEADSLFSEESKELLEELKHIYGMDYGIEACSRRCEKVEKPNKIAFHSLA